MAPERSNLEKMVSLQVRFVFVSLCNKLKADLRHVMYSSKKKKKEKERPQSMAESTF